MSRETITITSGSLEISDCSRVILVPEKAISEPGYIKTMTAGNSAHAKHEFHAMAQMAYYQYQDDELDIVEVADAIEISKDDQQEHLAQGMVIYRDSGGTFHVLIHQALSKKKMLEIANRYCTRWVRLDI